MEDESPVVSFTDGDGEIQITPHNGCVFTFAGALAVYNHITYDTGEVDDEGCKTVYVIAPSTDSAGTENPFYKLVDYMLDHAYPAVLNQRKLPSYITEDIEYWNQRARCATEIFKVVCSRSMEKTQTKTLAIYRGEQPDTNVVSHASSTRLPSLAASPVDNVEHFMTAAIRGLITVKQAHEYAKRWFISFPPDHA